MHIQSEKCFYPAGGRVPGETHPIVLSKCDKQMGRFRMYENGILQHVSSGMCIHPTGDCSTPEDNAELVLSKLCTGRERVFVINLDGILIHSSRTCVRPAHGSEAVPDGTRVVVHRFCTASKFSFAFIGKQCMANVNNTEFSTSYTTSTSTMLLFLRALLYVAWCYYFIRSFTTNWWQKSGSRESRKADLYVWRRRRFVSGGWQEEWGLLWAILLAHIALEEAMVDARLR